MFSVDAKYRNGKNTTLYNVEVLSEDELTKFGTQQTLPTVRRRGKVLSVAQCPLFRYNILYHILCDVRIS